MIDCLADYKYYVDFDKVYKNVDKYKVELNILNSLIGSKNIEQEFRDLVLKAEKLTWFKLMHPLNNPFIFITFSVLKFVKLIVVKFEQ